MELLRIKQGDAYSIPVELQLNGSAVDIAEVSAVEFMLGRHIRAVYPGGATYDDGVFYVPVTQKQTAALAAGLELPLDIRVKFNGGSVIGADGGVIVVVDDAMSGREI